MKEYTVMLDDEKVARLQRIAATRMTTEEELINDVIDSYIAESSQKRVFALDGAGRGAGGSIADISEEEYLKGFGG